MDIIVVEVKSLPEDLKFNSSVQDDEVVRALLSWVGVFNESDLDAVVPQFRELLRDNADPSMRRRGVAHGHFRVRALLCCPPASEEEAGELWCVIGSEIMRFADECFNPPERRQLCSTRYNFRQWGYALAPIVQYLKEPRDGLPTLEELYRRLGAT